MTQVAHIQLTANCAPPQQSGYIPHSKILLKTCPPTGGSLIGVPCSVFFSPYTFSAKERDLETGYSYFGARYYDAGLSIWLSVDPLSDKYPSMSAYMYCAGNPVMLVDPPADTAGIDRQERTHKVGSTKVAPGRTRGEKTPHRQPTKWVE